MVIGGGANGERVIDTIMDCDGPNSTWLVVSAYRLCRAKVYQRADLVGCLGLWRGKPQGTTLGHASISLSQVDPRALVSQPAILYIYLFFNFLIILKFFIFCAGQTLKPSAWPTQPVSQAMLQVISHAFF